MKIGVFIRDPGSANIAIAMYDELMGYGHDITMFCKDYSCLICRRNNISYVDIAQYGSGIEKDAINILLTDYNIEVALTGTSYEDEYERLVWKLCFEKHIQTFAFVDQWMNISQRFTDSNGLSVFPDVVLVIDDDMLKEVQTISKGITKCIVVGHPYFEKLTQKYMYRDLHTVVEEEKGRLTFFSQPLDYFYKDKLGYDEYSVFRAVLYACSELKLRDLGYRLVVRLHPKEDKDKFQERFHKEYQDELFTFDEVESPEESIQMSELVIGMFTTALLEASLIGKSFLSIQLNRNEAYNDMFILEQLGYCKSVVSYEEVIHSLKDMLFLKHRVKYRSFDGSIKKFINALEDYDGKISN